MVQFNMDVPKAIYIGTEEEASYLLQRLLNKVNTEPGEFIGFDTETHGKKIPLNPKKQGDASKSDPLDWMQDTITFWSLSAKLENYERWALPVQLLHKFIPLLENPKTWLATWNGKYDAHVCYNSGVYVFGSTYFDGLAMAALVDENMQGGLGLKEVASKENPFFHPLRKLDRDTYWEDLIKQGLIEEWVPIPMTKFTSLFPKKDPSGKSIVEYEYSIIDLFKHFPDRVSDYASLDAYATLRLCEHLRKVMQALPLSDLAEQGTMWDYFLRMEIPITEILWRMERRGLGINIDYLKGLLGPMEKELLTVEKDIWGLAGWPVNLNSPADLAQLFFGEKEGTIKRGKEQIPAPGLGIKPKKMTKGGKTKLPSPSTDSEVLEELAGNGIEAAKLIQRHRTLQKTKSTYVEAIVGLCNHHKDGRLHPEFKHFGARTGRFSTKTPNCVDGRTEVLTDQGWVRFDKLKKGYEIAQWSPSGVINFVQPENYVKEMYQGPMISIRNQHIDLLMTPRHRCPLRNRESGRIQVFDAVSYKENYKQLHGGIFEDGEPPTFKPSLDELRLLLAIQAKGVWNGKDVQFVFDNCRMAKRLKTTLKKLGIPFSFRFKSISKTSRYKFRVELGFFIRLVHILKEEKNSFGPWVLFMGKKRLRFFCNEVLFWNGHHESNMVYSSSSKKSADWVQIALTLQGRRAKIKEYKPSNPNEKVQYQVTHTPRDYSLTKNIEKTEVPWNDFVYCVTVPSGFILVRRNGRTCITGNSQNFPRPDTDEFKIRSAFVARPKLKNKNKYSSIKRKLVVGDYEQLEMRIMANFCLDEGMLNAIRSGLDLHCVTVEKMYGIPYVDAAKAKKLGTDREKVPLNKELLGEIVKLGNGSILASIAKNCLNGDTNQLKLLDETIHDYIRKRQECKTIGFGIIYGAGGKTIGLQLGIPPEDAEEKIDLYFAAFPGVKKYMEDTIEQCSQDEYVTTILGRRRRLPDINHHQFIKRGHAEREAINAKIQGSAADIVKAAMVSIEFSPELQKLGVKIINQVHDELVMECPEETVDQALGLIKTRMEKPFDGQDPLCVPTPCDVKIVDSWDRAK